LQAGTYLAQQPKRRAVVIGAATRVLIGGVDVLSGREISFSIFYLIPITFVTLRVGKTAGTFFSVISALIWMYADHWNGNVYSSSAIPIWNAAVRLGFFLIVTHALSALTVMSQWVHTDYLTGLTNRHGFYELTDKEIHRCRRSGHSFTLAYVDIDDFKSINDGLGHGAGDSLLRLVGLTLRKISRRSDVVARLGGDEFAILLPDATPATSVAALSKFNDSLSSVLRDCRWPLTFSIGAATFETSPDSVDAALELADHLMYEAKHSGKGKIIHRSVNRAEPMAFGDSPQS